MSIDSTTRRPGAPQQDRGSVPRLGVSGLSVPWKTVVALAVVMAYADGFWLTSLRGAVGAIERAQSPFASWLRESTLVLPVFVFAVLAVLTLALRWFGPVVHRPRAVAATALLIVAAGTVVGLAAIVASSAYDYHLQSAQLRLMDSMHAICTGNCLAQEQHATFALHVRAVIYISRWLLLTNLVLVAWLVAMWGGRLKVATTRGQADAASDGPTDAELVTGRSRVTDMRLLLVGALVASAAVHAALVPGHLSEWAGALFLFLTVWELAVAGMLLARLEERMVLLAAVVISIAPLLLWASSGTAALPGAVVGVLEVASLLAAVVLLRAPGWLARPASAHLRGLVVVGLIALAAIGVAGTGLSWFDVFGISGTQSVMDMKH
jgi:hypothetical protein